MADNRSTRQQLYDRIRESSKEEVILEEMKRMGFWGKDEQGPGVPELLIRRETELNKELNQLLQEKKKFQNKEAVLKELRMKRMAEARLKREENKKKREQQRFEKAAAWRKRRETEILYLGAQVSVGLNDVENDLAALEKYRLPVFHNESELATAMGITLKELRFLAFSRKVSMVSHYRKFYLPKKSGGKRLISAPMPRLKRVQYWILTHLFNPLTIHPAANGFAIGRSIVTNAQEHTGKSLVVNIDVKDFFPSIHYKRVKGLLRRLGYSEKIATLIALLCTEPATEGVEMDGKKYFVQKGERVLPQGAPTSPAITNLLCFKMDKRLQGLAEKNHCAYTRYADDISFSTSEPGINAQQLVWRIKRVLSDEGFTMHPDKVRIMQKGARQEVTGIVVNKTMGVPREKLRQFRALLHQLSLKDPAGLSWGQGNLASSITGYANFIKMVDPVKGAAFQQQIALLFQSGRLQYPVAAGTATATKKGSNPGGAAGSTGDGQPPAGDSSPEKPWWNVT
jgi:RNA-directed DNA polymerase